MRLGTRVMIGFILLIIVSGISFAYLIRSSNNLESQIRLANSIYLPAVKALNQIESALFLLEADIDSSIQEGILRPKESLEEIINARTKAASDLLSEKGAVSVGVLGEWEQFLAAKENLSTELASAYQNWNERSSYVSRLSGARAEFRTRLKSLIRVLDMELSRNSKELEITTKRLEKNLILFSLAGILVSFFVLIYLRRSFDPLEKLAHLMREVSEKGLQENLIKKLSLDNRAVGEIALLWGSFGQMAKSLFDQSSTLQSQKMNLEKIHTEVAHQNEELKRARAKLLQSEKLSLVGQMSAQMAHEIRNPLNAMGLHTEILESTMKEKKMDQELVLPIKREIQRLIELTDSYLNVSKEPKLEVNSFQINDILEDVHQLYAPLFREKGVFFSCDLADLPKMAGDRSKLLQAITNLIKNSYEAFDEGEINKSKFVRLISQANGAGDLEISVLDNGKGISADQQNDLFSAFQTTKAQGSGLGLITAKQVVEAHRGSISCESSLGKGTKFTIRLPLLTNINQGVRLDGWVQSKDTHS